MTEEMKKPKETANWLSLISIGFFLILLGATLIATPNVTDEVGAFVNPKNWHVQNVTSNIAFPEPKSNYPVLYTAIMQFCLIFGAFQVVILALRFAFHESINRKADTVSGIAFWFSIGFFLNMLANELVPWFGFVAGIVISAGLALLSSSIVKLFR